TNLTKFLEVVLVMKMNRKATAKRTKETPKSYSARKWNGASTRVMQWRCVKWRPARRRGILTLVDTSSKTAGGDNLQIGRKLRNFAFRLRYYGKISPSLAVFQHTDDFQINSAVYITGDCTSYKGVLTGKREARGHGSP